MGGQAFYPKNTFLTLSETPSPAPPPLPPKIKYKLPGKEKVSASSVFRLAERCQFLFSLTVKTMGQSYPYVIPASHPRQTAFSTPSITHTGAALFTSPENEKSLFFKWFEKVYNIAKRDPLATNKTGVTTIKQRNFVWNLLGVFPCVLHNFGVFPCIPHKSLPGKQSRM